MNPRSRAGKALLFIETGLLLALAIVASGQLASASVVANFTDGNGTATPDAYLGTAGAGWQGAWVLSNTTGASSTNNVVNTAPINDGGNYLSVSSAGSNNSGVYRQLAANNPINLSQSYTISWDFRLDSWGGNPNLTTFSSFNDRIHFFGNPTGSASTGATNTWAIGVGAADNGTAQTVPNGNWYFFDNNGSSDFVEANMFNTGVALAVGVTYSFTVTVNPQTFTYDATISYLSGSETESVTATGLTFRSGTNVAGQTASYLGFGSIANSTDEGRVWSFDSLTIDQVPEPSLAASIVCGLAMLAFRRRR